MLRRFKLFFIGMVMGTIVVVWAFGERLGLMTSWFPNERVLVRFQQTELKQTAKAQCLMACFGIHRKHIDSLIKEGDIDFKKSDTHVKPLIYIVNHQAEELGEYQITFAAADSTSTIIDANVLMSRTSCDCPD